MNPKDYIKLPYSRIIIPEEDGEGYFISILEFQGCLSQGDTLEEAMSNIEDAMECWIEASIDLGHAIPEPLQNKEGSVFGIAIPPKDYIEADSQARKLGLSLEKYILSLIQLENWKVTWK